MFSLCVNILYVTLHLCEYAYVNLYQECMVVGVCVCVKCMCVPMYVTTLSLFVFDQSSCVNSVYKNVHVLLRILCVCVCRCESVCGRGVLVNQHLSVLQILGRPPHHRLLAYRIWVS